MKNTIIVMIWVTIIVIGLFYGITNFIDSQRQASEQAQNHQLQQLSTACMNSITDRFKTSGDANIKDIYSYDTPDQVWLAKHAAQVQCSIVHPDLQSHGY